MKELPEDCGPEEDSGGGGDPGGAVASVAVADALVGLGTKGVAALAVVHLAVEGGLEAARAGVVLVAAGVLWGQVFKADSCAYFPAKLLSF